MYKIIRYDLLAIVNGEIEVLETYATFKYLKQHLLEHDYFSGLKHETKMSFQTKLSEDIDIDYLNELLEILSNENLEFRAIPRIIEVKNNTRVGQIKHDIESYIEKDGVTENSLREILKLVDRYYLEEQEEKVYEKIKE